MVSNEVFIGAGAIVTMAPECDIFLSECTVSGVTATIVAGVTNDFFLVPDLYTGCVAKIDTGVDGVAEQYLMIKSNTISTIIFDEDISQVPIGPVGITILAYGAPIPGKRATSTLGTILSDNWLGLVNTFSPPNIEVEMKQMNLAAAGGRNFDYQFKTRETVSGASLDLSLNNGSWLYYALGKITSMSGGESSIDLIAGSDGNIAAHKGFYTNHETQTMVRAKAGVFYPPLSNSAGAPVYRAATDASVSGFGDMHQWDGTPIKYTFGEANGDTLPSFALEVLYSKDGRTGTTAIDALTPNENMISRVFTGCQVNSLTLTFEEGMELKTSLDLMTRRAFDMPNANIPMHGVVETTPLTAAAGLANFSANTTDNYPFLYSGGAIKLFGQTVSRIKTGSLVISNNLTAQTYVGNYNRQMVSTHIPAQRTYELSLTMMITDTEVWDELRNANEISGSTNQIELVFTKESSTITGGNAETETIKIVLEDYLINGVTIPFPEDKGPLEVEVTATARTLGTDTFYEGTWGIVTVGGVASQN
jgi:hypothetical protein